MNDLLVYLLESYGLNASAGETVAEVEDEEGDEKPQNKLDLSRYLNFGVH